MSSNFGPSTLLNTQGLAAPDDQARKVSPEGEPVSRALPSEGAVVNLVTRLVQDNNQRNARNGKIVSKLNSESPWQAEELKKAGLAWKSNFTTRPLNTLVAKVVGRFPKAVNSARFLTASSLPPTVDKAEKKTEFFRREITLFLRGQPGWNDLVDVVTHEVVLFGYTGTAALNADDVLPKPFRQDQFFVPAGTRQSSAVAPFAVFSVEESPAVVFQTFKDAQLSAEENGDQRWDIPAFAEAINNALPENQRTKMTFGEDARAYQDLARQVNLGTSFAGSEKVRLFHVLAAELTGRVSHYIVSGGSDSKLLFAAPDRFDSMDAVTQFFTFEFGDGTVHGSKGLGRTAYAFATVLDRARNDAVDRMQLAGKLILQGPDNNASRLKMNVVGNVITFSSDWTISQNQIQANVEASVTLDDYLRRLLDEMAGSVSPTTFAGRDRVTKEEIDLLASREGERSDDVLGRFLTQFGGLVSSVQRRILDPGHPNEQVKAFQQKLLTVLTPEEMEMLRQSPALRVVEDWSNVERQAIIMAATETMGNPLVDNKRLLWEKLSAQVSPEFANRVLLPDEDPTVLAEATRMQMLENVALGTGVPVPTSPRDNHAVHLKTMLPLFASALQAAGADPGQLGSLQFILQHAVEHLNAAKQQKIADPELVEIENQLKQVETAMQQAMVEQQNASVDSAAGGVVPGGGGPTGPVPEQPNGSPVA